MLKLSLFDRAIVHFDAMLRGKCANNNYPAKDIANSTSLTEAERKQAIAMLRVNHSGEVCAQALYQGQALMSRSSPQYHSLLEAAAEENDHLNWCKQRLQELHGSSSFLNPLWYAGSFTIGMIAGAAGDKISLGFLAETEYQVTEHLEKHLRHISPNDLRSRSILEQMRTDELQHATKAVAAGAVELPGYIKFAMRCTAKVMTVTAGKI